ncbi:MAG TPA: hypothetical protein VNW92_09365, partial [Polyangiaceae bacterium]|nr:hypothetical protein [Polyangiaceae bacterium]
AHGALFGAGSGWEQRLVTALLNDLTGHGSSDFLPAIDSVLAKLQRADGNLSMCQVVLSALRREIKQCAGEDAVVLGRIDELFEGAGALVSEFLVRVEISRKLSTVAELREFSQTSALLLGHSSLAELRESFEDHFRALGIPALTIGLFTEPGKVTQQCLCLAAYNSARRTSPVEETFRSSDFGPPDHFAHERGALLVQPIVFEGEPMGIVTVVLGTLDVTIFEQLREILGTGLRGFRLAAAARAASK